MSATYRLTGRIESGELAELYEAILAPSSDVVVKLFHPKTSDPTYALDLAETTRLLQPVRHPGILHVVDIGVVRQRLAVVREDLDGHLLGTALQRLHMKDVVLPPAVALYIIIQLLDAVQQAHDAGVLHGALTPGNVVLGRSGQPAICDFGAIRALTAVPQLRKSFAGRGRGTYRAPEVSRGDAPSEQSDVYSLGAIAYELLTQREPVAPGGGGVSTRRSEGLPPPSRLDRRINARLDPLILRALDPSAGRRFRSCAEFANALRNFLSASGGMPTAEDVRRFVGELFPNEMSVSLAPPVFKEPFTLEPISGAEMDALGAEEPEASIVQRAPYSRALTEEEANAETQEAAGPAFEDYRPQDYEPDIAPSHASTRAPQPSPPTEGEGTQLAAGLAQGWDAPPGAAPPKPRRQQGQGAGAGQGAAKPPGRNPRLRVVEDFSSPAPPPDDDEEFSVVGRRAAARAAAKRAAPPVDRSRTLPDPMPAVAPVARPREDIAMPPPSAPALPAAALPSRPGGTTTDHEVRRIQGRRGMLVAIAGAIALVGFISFAIAAWKLGGSDDDTALDDAPMPELAPVPPPPPEAIRPPPTPAQSRAQAEARAEEAAGGEEEPLSASRPPPKNQRGFLTVEANVPARVYIDGALVARSTPLTRFPVRVGVRSIMLVAISTGERQQLELRIEKGKLRQVNVPSFRRR
ncbi:serine/threonine protein kinase [Myxococcus stipitatus]|uniref:serine/threonine protein kinase n=1 Tax=Myxococcus stipitatus TaxID=83455 RepID=UPI001F254596|nr:serine/threonine-protein kinase [Myxococcus stipitatus]MCE9671132.1 serine/threonine protein kinase [Myxococcus stipitatus]